MARITVEDCQKQISNRFLIVQIACKRVSQYRKGYNPLITSSNKEIITSLREIAAGKVLARPSTETEIKTDKLQD